MSGKVFGVDLQTLVTQQNTDIPKLVTHILDFLKKKEAYLEEGLFRIPGNTLKITELKRLVEKDGKLDLFKYKDVDSHTASGLLKLYLRELPVPIIIPRYYSTFLKVYANPEPKQRMINTRKLILGLPKCNRDLLLVVMKFLNLVAEHQAVNKMSASNLALIFAPNLIRTQNETLTQIMEDSSKVAGTIQLLIQEVDYLLTATEPAWFALEPSHDFGRSKSGSIPPSPRFDTFQNSPSTSSFGVGSTLGPFATSTEQNSLSTSREESSNSGCNSNGSSNNSNNNNGSSSYRTLSPIIRSRQEGFSPRIEITEPPASTTTTTTTTALFATTTEDTPPTTPHDSSPLYNTPCTPPGASTPLNTSAHIDTSPADSPRLVSSLVDSLPIEISPMETPPPDIPQIDTPTTVDTPPHSESTATNRTQSPCSQQEGSPSVASIQPEDIFSDHPHGTAPIASEVIETAIATENDAEIQPSPAEEKIPPRPPQIRKATLGAISPPLRLSNTESCNSFNSHEDTPEHQNGNGTHTSRDDNYNDGTNHSRDDTSHDLDDTSHDLDDTSHDLDDILTQETDAIVCITEEGTNEPSGALNAISDTRDDIPPRAITPFCESRPGPLDRRGEFSPHHSPLSSPKHDDPREPTQFSFSEPIPHPDLSSREDSAALQGPPLRRRSESDTTTNNSHEKIMKEEKPGGHSRHRSNTFLAIKKIGAMTFRRNTISRNSSEASLSSPYGFGANSEGTIKMLEDEKLSTSSPSASELSMSQQVVGTPLELDDSKHLHDSKNDFKQHSKLDVRYDATKHDTKNDSKHTDAKHDKHGPKLDIRYDAKHDRSEESKGDSKLDVRHHKHEVKHDTKHDTKHDAKLVVKHDAKHEVRSGKGSRLNLLFGSHSTDG